MSDREAFAKECPVAVDAGDGKRLGSVPNKFFLRFHQTLHQRLALGGGKEKGILSGLPMHRQPTAAGDPVDLDLKQRDSVVQPLGVAEKNKLAHFKFQLAAAKLKGGFSAIAPPAGGHDLRFCQNLPAIMRVGVVTNSGRKIPFLRYQVIGNEQRLAGGIMASTRNHQEMWKCLRVFGPFE